MLDLGEWNVLILPATGVITALLLLVLDLTARPKRSLPFTILALLGLLAEAVFLRILAPAQGMLSLDPMAGVLALPIVVGAALAVAVSEGYIDEAGVRAGEYYALLFLALAGMLLLTMAVHLAAVFLGLEILSIGLYALTGINRRSPLSAEAAFKYLVMGGMASGIVLFGIALLYGATGSLTLQDIGVALGENFPPTALLALVLLAAGFGFKVALAPFQMWTPDVYQGAPTPVSLFMSVGGKAAGFAALLRLIAYAFAPAWGAWRLPLALLALFTMLWGNFAALRQDNLKRMLAYSSVAHAGYLLAGLVAFSLEGWSAVVFYLMAYAAMTGGAFAVLAALENPGESGAGLTLEDVHGLADGNPAMAAALAVFLLSLTGIPPLAGFWAKVFVFGAAIKSGLSWLAVLGFLNGAFSALYYLRVVAEMYSRTPRKAPIPVGRLAATGIFLALALVIILGLWPKIWW